MKESITPSLHVYSASCTWSGPISAVGKTQDLPETTARVGCKPDGTGGTEIKIGGAGSGLPCCPHCGSMLFQIDEKKWWDGANAAEPECPNYINFLKWKESQPTCWRNMRDAVEAYNASPENADKKHIWKPFTQNEH